MSAKKDETQKPAVSELSEMIAGEQKSTNQPQITTLTHVSKTDMEISSMVQGQDESFPDISDIKIEQPWQDPFQIPKWCDKVNYEYGWASVHDKVQLDDAINARYWRIVNRSNHYSAPLTDFHHTHGALERRGMILMYRPMDIANKMRQIPVILHRERTEAIEAGKQLSGAEVTTGRFDGETSEHKTFSGVATGSGLRPGDDPKPGDIFASEEPGGDGKLRIHEGLRL